VDLERGPLSLVRTTEELLGRNSSGWSRKPRLTTWGIRCADHASPSIRRSWHYFANKRRSLGRHSSLADQNHSFFIARVSVIKMKSSAEEIVSGLDSEASKSARAPHINLLKKDKWKCYKKIGIATSWNSLFLSSFFESSEH
jgi:hypothetical protein